MPEIEKIINIHKFICFSRTKDTRRLPKFCSSELGQRPNGSAFVVTKGRALFKSTCDLAEDGMDPQPPSAIEERKAALEST